MFILDAPVTFIHYPLTRYRQGMMKAKEELVETTKSAVNLATEQMMTQIEHQKVEDIEEDSIDSLLSWTNALDFEE